MVSTPRIFGNTADVIVLDLDGTVSDPLVGIARSINHALHVSGFERRATAEIARLVGPPIDVTFEVLAGPDNRNLVPGLVALYRQRYGSVGFAENQLYPGITEGLETLHRRGVPLGLCTSKRSDFAEKILDLFGIRKFFDFIDGGDIGVTKHQQLSRLLGEGTIGAESWMVGDRSVDVEAAKAIGIRSAAVLWGFGSRDELESCSPDRILSTPSELAELTS